MVSSAKVTLIVLLELPKLPESLELSILVGFSFTGELGREYIGDYPAEGGSYSRRRVYVPLSRSNKVDRR